MKGTFEKFRGEIDIVMGGPPCQGFSQKGKRVGITDDRNFLFRQFVKVVDIVQPEFILLENVPNILSAESGYFKNEIIKLFSELGYDLKASVLKAENFGVPQTRRRAVFLGQKGKLRVTIPTGANRRTTVNEAISDLPVLPSGGGLSPMAYDKPPTSFYQKKMRNGSYEVWNHVATKHSELALERLSMISVGDTKDVLPIKHRTRSIHSGTWTRLDPNGFARTITTRFDTPSSGQFTLPDQDRCITVREAARLQSFPDTFIFIGTKSSQMLQVGNAVPPLLARAIASEVKDYLASAKREKILARSKHVPVRV